MHQISQLINENRLTIIVRCLKLEECERIVASR